MIKIIFNRDLEKCVEINANLIFLQFLMWKKLKDFKDPNLLLVRTFKSTLLPPLITKVQQEPKRKVPHALKIGGYREQKRILRRMRIQLKLTKRPPQT
tara:strand:+ start:795 stop:1088 length:294 start_codon:yes stop_codon:yes gene_type:complete